MKMVNLSAVLFGVCSVLACGGCNIISVLGAPTAHEKRIPAEYDLVGSSKKVLVLVEKAAGSNAGPGLADDLGGKMNRWLIEKAGMREEFVVPAGAISLLRAKRDDFARLSPVEIAKICDADLVLYVLIEDYELYAMNEGRYYSGSMMTRSVIFDSSLDRVIWPKADEGEVVKIKVELETKGHDALDKRMINATSHCIVRKLYNCRMTKFRVRDELPEFDDEKW